MKNRNSVYTPEITLSSKEMFKISQEISRDYAPAISIPDPELMLIPVDPYHLYAYWNLGNKLETDASISKGENNLVLRVFWQPAEDCDAGEVKLWFDLPIDQTQHQRQVRLPIDATAYSAVVGIRDSQQIFEILAFSNHIQVPRGRIAAKEQQETPFIPGNQAKSSELVIQDEVAQFIQEALKNSAISDFWYEEGMTFNIKTSPKNEQLSKLFHGSSKIG